VCPRVAFEPLWTKTSALRHTERSLQLDGSHHDRITQLVIHQQQPESQELLPVAALAPVRPNPAEGLASHSCEAGLSQCHPHIARYHTTTCQQLANSAEGVTPPRRSTPFDGLGSYTSLGGWQHHVISRAATAACAEAGGASEGRALGRIPSRSIPSCSQHHHPIPHLQACS
jgi:hypothetical protein